MKISIVTPSYNQGSYISETFESILDQNISEIEYIVMDGKSSDDTSKIAEKYAPLFKEKQIDFKFISEHDKGQSDAINKGWRRCHGDIITYINSDDFYTNSALSAVVEYFKNNPKTMWAYGGWNFVDQEGRICLTNQPKEYSKQKLLDYCNIVQPSCFFRKKVLDEIGYLNADLHLTMDYDFWLRISTKYEAGIIPCIISCARFHKDAKSVEFAKKQLRETYSIASKYTKPISMPRLRQIYFYFRGLLAVYLRISKTQKIIEKQR